MKQTTKSLGYAAEGRAAAWLEKRGYWILERNATFAGAEIDFVCEKDGLTVFVELKWRSGDEYGDPEEAFTYAKRRATARAVALWCARHGADPDAVRMDFLAAERLTDGSTDWRLYENVELG
jgi:putative endonuclease